MINNISSKKIEMLITVKLQKIKKPRLYLIEFKN